MPSLYHHEQKSSWGDDAESTTRFPQNEPIQPNPTQSNPISRLPISTKLHFHLSCLPFRSHCKLFLCMTQCCQCLVSDGMCLNIFPFRLIVGVMNSSKRVMSRGQDTSGADLFALYWLFWNQQERKITKLVTFAILLDEEVLPNGECEK